MKRKPTPQPPPAAVAVPLPLLVAVDAQGCHLGMAQKLCRGFWLLLTAQRHLGQPRLRLETSSQAEAVAWLRGLPGRHHIRHKHTLVGGGHGVLTTLLADGTPVQVGVDWAPPRPPLGLAGPQQEVPQPQP